MNKNSEHLLSTDLGQKNVISALQSEFVTYLGLDRLPVDISDIFSVEWEQNRNSVSTLQTRKDIFSLNLKNAGLFTFVSLVDSFYQLNHILYIYTTISFYCVSY